MAYCKKCGAYIPIGETACPACGYDPEAEARQAREKKEREEEEARRKKAAEEAAEKERQEKERRAQQQKSWAEQERKREEERRRREREARQGHGYSSGAAQSQYASQSASQSQYSSQHTGSQAAWTPPWQESQSHGGYSSSYAKNKARAADSAANQKLSVLSYLGPLFLIPLFTRPNDDFARFHANQGLNLFLFNGLLTLLGNASGLIPTVGGLFALYCTFKGIGNVLKGKKEPLPLIGKFHFLK